MPLEEIQKLLKQHMGLHAATIGTATVDHAVTIRMSACHMGDIGEYAAHASRSPAELKQLVEAVVIPETWFFRDLKPFVALKKLVTERFRHTTPDAPLRALSLPCSTGEEPYSIAISLLEAGLRPEQFTIDAVDISQKALESALCGSYGKHSFRGQQDPEVLDRYFTRKNDRLVVTERVRDPVIFRHGNIMDEPRSLPTGAYHIVFCRNLLIYFDDATKHRAFTVLHSLLRDDGSLFLGHAECGSAPRSLFSIASHAHAFAFDKATDAKQHAAKNNAEQRKKTRKAIPKSTAASKPALSTKKPRRPEAPVSPPPKAPIDTPSPDDLERARRLADEGQFEEAATICDRYLKVPEKQAQAYYLLGLIHTATGQADRAEQHLRKAIYLDPRHYESLVHLALLVGQKGDTANAELLRRRAERARPA